MSIQMKFVEGIALQPQSLAASAQAVRRGVEPLGTEIADPAIRVGRAGRHHTVTRMGERSTNPG